MARTRNDAFKSSPRLPDEGPSRFLEKLDPWFVEFARFFREDTRVRPASRKQSDRLGQPHSKKYPAPVQRPPVVALSGWPRTIGEMFDLLVQDKDPRFAQAIRAMEQKIPKQGLAIDLNQVLPNIISLLKYQTTTLELWRREMQGDKRAGKHLVESMDLYNRWVHEQLPRGGVRFKTNVHHNLLMLYGLVGGIQRLTSRELADFFDHLCPCGGTHTLEVLARLRCKLLKTVARCSEATDPISATPRARNGTTLSKRRYKKNVRNKG